MKVTTTLASTLLAIAVVAVSSTELHAIVIRNGSFESDTVADGGFITTTIDWNETFATDVDSGVLNPAGVGTPPVPNGINTVFLNSTGFLTQNIEALEVGGTVHLTLLAVASTGTPDLTVDIRTAANVSILTGGIQSALVSNTGEYAQFDFTLNVATAELAPVLTIGASGGGQLLLDSVRAVPEPSTGLLAMFGMLGLVTRRRKTRSRV